MLPGSSDGTMIASLFRVKSVRPVTPGPSFSTKSIHAGLAEAKTSTGAPSFTWAAKPSDGPKLKVTVTPGLSASKSVPMTSNASVSDDAADTVRSWSTSLTASSPGLLHARRAPAPRTRVRARHVSLIDFQHHVRGFDGRYCVRARLQLHLVDGLTRNEGEDRYGPASISTVAATLSLRISVADHPAVDCERDPVVTLGRPRRSLRRRAISPAGTRRCPPEVLVVSSFPRAPTGEGSPPARRASRRLRRSGRSPLRAYPAL